MPSKVCHSAPRDRKMLGYSQMHNYGVKPSNLIPGENIAEVENDWPRDPELAVTSRRRLDEHSINKAHCCVNRVRTHEDIFRAILVEAMTPQGLEGRDPMGACVVRLKVRRKYGSRSDQKRLSIISVPCSASNLSSPLTIVIRTTRHNTVGK